MGMDFKKGVNEDGSSSKTSNPAPLIFPFSRATNNDSVLTIPL